MVQRASRFGLPYASNSQWAARWVYFNEGSVLHRVALVISTAEETAEVQGVTLCGRAGRLTMPGFVGRLAAPRCHRCCSLRGTPRGHGAPFNDPTLDRGARELAPFGAPWAEHWVLKDGPRVAR